MDPGTDACQTEQPQISHSVDFIAEQSTGSVMDNKQQERREKQCFCQNLRKIKHSFDLRESNWRAR